MFLNRATIKEHPEAIDSNVIRATRLMRLFLEQVEALQKLQGKTGQQKVVVEHVHVNEGGQAIVGAVSATNGEGEISDAGAWTSCETKRMAESTAIRPEISLRRRVVARRPGAGHLVWALPCTTPVAGCMGGRAPGRKTAEGMARSRQATKHGRYSNSAKAERAAYRLLMRQCREVLDSL